MEAPPASYKAWLDDFRRDVDIQLQAPAPPPPPAPAPAPEKAGEPPEGLALLAEAVSRLQSEVLDHRERLARLEGRQPADPSTHEKLHRAISLLKSATEELRGLAEQIKGGP